ncbi:hypothetical protein P5673_022306 [Acropora cervicornis]|uniref:BEN domain-containing protein n=1 Tax=Acropora cervicornis TaxID=6130 RepID=A0AAD9UZI0_ACRCE|nr:hypothetical protein P5673_022306 [Acropora cervicornis]
MLLQESNSAHEREVPTSYTIKAYFKPSEGEVFLVKGHDVFVSGNKVRHLINESRMKGPIHLLQKLITLVFTVEELANSCGQGISSNVSSKTKVNGDLSRKLLDHAKTKVFKDYLLSFCVPNGKDCPQPKQINEIFTQHIS